MSKVDAVAAKVDAVASKVDAIAAEVNAVVFKCVFHGFCPSGDRGDCETDVGFAVSCSRLARLHG